MVLSFRLAAMGLLALASAQEVSCLRSARIIFRTNDPDTTAHSTLAPFAEENDRHIPQRAPG